MTKKQIIAAYTVLVNKCRETKDLIHSLADDLGKLICENRLLRDKLEIYEIGTCYHKDGTFWYCDLDCSILSKQELEILNKKESNYIMKENDD